MNATFTLLPGDGIGPEIVSEAHRLLDAIAAKFGHTFEYHVGLIGGCAIDEDGDPLPQRTIDLCRQSDAILLGAVGGPKWDDPNAKTRPEKGLLAIRKEFGLFANLRPISLTPALAEASPIKSHIVSGTDILFVRELTGGIYFGGDRHSGEGSEETATSEMTYTAAEIERVVRIAGEAARGRRGKLTMVDKANVLEVSRLWRRVSQRVVEAEFSDLDYEVVLVDAMAMHLISRPTTFDVVVTANLFGDILTDEASMLPGSMGLLPSASLGEGGPGLYEPIHGSAPDIAGQGVANPLATFLAAAMMLRHSCSMEEEAAAIETAVNAVIDAGHRTRDLGDSVGGGKQVGTTEMADLVIAELG